MSTSGTGGGRAKWLVVIDKHLGAFEKSNLVQTHWILHHPLQHLVSGVDELDLVQRAPEVQRLVAFLLVQNVQLDDERVPLLAVLGVHLHIEERLRRDVVERAEHLVPIQTGLLQLLSPDLCGGLFGF